MKIENFEEFQMTDTGYILVSKRTHTICAISFSNGDILNVAQHNQEDQLQINGMFLNGAQHYESQFIAMMKSIYPSKDKLALNALYALKDCYCSPSIQNIISSYLD